MFQAWHTPLARPVEVESAWSSEADARTRTADPFITSEVLYQLSYVGEASKCTAVPDAFLSRA